MHFYTHHNHHHHKIHHPHHIIILSSSLWSNWIKSETVKYEPGRGKRANKSISWNPGQKFDPLANSEDRERYKLRRKNSGLSYIFLTTWKQLGIIGEEKSEIYINSVSLERRLQTEKNFFWLKQYFFTTQILEILWDIVGSSVENSEICINSNSPCHFSLHALDSLSSLEALSIFNSLIDIIPQSITMQILKYFQSISLQQDEGGGCTWWAL